MEMRYERARSRRSQAVPRTVLGPRYRLFTFQTFDDSELKRDALTRSCTAPWRARRRADRLAEVGRRHLRHRQRDRPHRAAKPRTSSECVHLHRPRRRAAATRPRLPAQAARDRRIRRPASITRTGSPAACRSIIPPGAESPRRAIQGRSQSDRSARVMRLPGFIHQKAEPFRTRIMRADRPDSL